MDANPSKRSEKRSQPSATRLSFRARERLMADRRTLQTLSEELEHLPSQAKAGSTRLFDQADEQLAKLEEEFERLSYQSDVSVETWQDFLNELSEVQAIIHRLFALKIRRQYRRNLGLLEERLASYRVHLPEDELQAILQESTSRTQEQIQSLKAKKELTPSEQLLLSDRQRDLERYQEILTGKRPYTPSAPPRLLLEIYATEQKIKDIDADLAS